MKTLSEIIENTRYDSIENDLSCEELNESRLRRKNLLINSTDKENFYHSFDIMSSNQYANWLGNIISETLNSTKSSKFIKWFEDKFQNKLNKIRYVDSSIKREYDKAAAFVVPFKNLKNLKENFKEILEACKFRKYYITKVHGTSLIIEPTITEEVTKEIKNNFNNKIYHVTKKSKIIQIKKLGLYVTGYSKSNIEDPIVYLDQAKIEEINSSIPKSLRDTLRSFLSYRNFTDRTFVFYTKLDIEKNFKKIINTIKSTDRYDEYCVIEFNLKTHHIPLFRDTMMSTKNNGLYYAYSNIDINPKLISEIYEL